MDLVGEDLKPGKPPITELDIFSDPVMFYVNALITTYSATTMDAILERFSGAPEVLGYVRQVVVSMEESGLITFQNGRYESKNSEKFTTFIRGHFQYLIPSLLKSAASRVFSDFDSGTHKQKSEFCSIYYMPDSPPKRAKLNALIAEFNKRAHEIIQEDYTTDSTAVRLGA
jgi:hypothetical protein